MFKLEKIEPIKIDDYRKDKKGCINPFHTDLYNMGKKISDEVYMMYDFHDTEPFRNAYFINIRTGERQRILVTAAQT